MNYFLLLFLLFSFLNFGESFHSNLNYLQPPSITKGPGYEQLFQVNNAAEKSDVPFSLECEASGNPEPKYYWKKNSLKFDYVAYDKRISQQPKRGTLVFNKPEAMDEGLYQCFAQNSLGVSLSNAVFLRKAELNSFSHAQVEKIDVEEGSPFSIDCNPPTGYPKPFIHWLINSNSATLKTLNSSRLTWDPEGKLHFSNVTKDDQLNNGVYSCYVSNHVMSEFKIGRKIDLKVKSSGSTGQISYPPVVHYISPPNIPAIKGKSLELHCIYGGTPLPQITWNRKSGSIEDNKYNFINYGKTLQILSVDFKDEDIFECTASNGIGRQQTHAMQVTVQAAPFWVKSPENTEAPENETVKFECLANGIPKPKLQWFKNGVPLEEDSLNSRRILEGNVLTIHSLVKTDTSVYQCNASNIHGYAFKDFYLNVIALPPTIIEKPDPITQTVATASVLMKCKVFGAPKPEVKWLKNNVALTGGKYEILNNGYLKIKDVMITDQGEYICHAKNAFGENQTSTVLEVKTKTIITDSPSNIEVQAGTNAVFRCNAKADPTLDLELIWSFNDVQIDFAMNQRMTKTASNALSIGRTIELDSGVYSCTARTKLDNATAEATLTVQDVPNPPKITNMNCNNTLAKIEWESTGDRRAPILFYSIQYNTSFKPDVWEYIMHEYPATENSLAARMNPWSNYTFRVIAKNKIGFSEPSKPSEQCSTLPDIPFKNPDNVKGKGTTPNNLVISWSAMDYNEHNAPGFFYKVFWKSLDKDNEAWYQKTITNGTQSKLVIENTPTFRPYRIKVEAHNSRGQSPLQPTEVIGYSGEARPLDAPKNFMNIPPIFSKSASFKWEPVRLESIRGHFRGYKVQTWTAEESEDQLRELKVPNNVTNAQLNVLRPNSRNYVQVLAYNDQYNGPPSERIEVVTPEGVPGPVASIGAVPMGNSALLVYWEKPIETNGVLIGYNVFYQELKGRNIETKIEKKPRPNERQRRIKLGHLKPDTTYRIIVNAVTKAGLGESNFIEKKTRSDSEPNSVPGTPKFILSRLPFENGKVGVRVTWLPNIESGRPGSEFYLRYRKKGEEKFLSSTKRDTLDPVPIEGLDPGEVYEFKVVSQDGNYIAESEIEEISMFGYGGLEIAEGSTSHFNKPDWFIGVVCSIGLAILSAVMVCLVKRNRGGKYSVQEKEQRHGRSIEYREDSGGFFDFSHKSGELNNPFSGSTASFNEDDHDDNDSYEENEKIGEDGSFIGEYGVKTRKTSDFQTGGNPTFV